MLLFTPLELHVPFAVTGNSKLAMWFKGYREHEKASKVVQMAGSFKWMDFLMSPEIPGGPLESPTEAGTWIHLYFCFGWEENAVEDISKTGFIVVRTVDIFFRGKRCSILCGGEPRFASQAPETPI